MKCGLHLILALSSTILELEIKFQIWWNRVSHLLRPDHPVQSAGNRQRHRRLLRGQALPRPQAGDLDVEGELVAQVWKE